MLVDNFLDPNMLHMMHDVIFFLQIKYHGENQFTKHFFESVLVITQVSLHLPVYYMYEAFRLEQSSGCGFDFDTLYERV